MSQTNAQLLADSLGTASTGTVPIGGIILWSGSTGSVPTGWALCDGTNGTPNLQDRFVVGAGSGYAVDATGGSADAVVVSHTHKSPVGTAAGGGQASLQGNFAAGNINTGSASGGVSGTNANLPPYYALAYIMRTS
jgi:hypothetical protein